MSNWSIEYKGHTYDVFNMGKETIHTYTCVRLNKTINIVFVLLCFVSKV